MALVIRTERKSQPAYDQDPRARAIDELQRISADHRDKFLGQNWYPEVRDFYNLTGSGTRTPSFRPRVNIPQLQVLNLIEATELSDSSPRVFIYNRLTGKVDDQRSKAFDEQWRQSYVNYYLLHAILWSQISSMGWMMVGYDPTAAYGLGDVWAHHVDPETVYPDPGAMTTEDWQYVCIENRYYPDQITDYWPETGRDIEAEPYMPGSYHSPEGFGFRLPEGPMSVTSGPVGGEVRRGDARSRVRTLFLADHTVEVTADYAGSDAARTVASGFGPPKQSVRKMPRYPNKRMVVETQGRVVADGDNPNPKGRFPLVPIYALPPLTDFYPPPPSRFSKDLQDLAGRMMTQTYENAVRLNNGVWFIPEESGITAEAFGGVPGEVQMMATNSRNPVQMWPNQMPIHMVQLPQLLLSLQKELQGFSQSREGQPGAGNISPELFEASIYQSRTLTRCRERLLARSVHQLSEQLFDLMVYNYRSQRAFPTIDSDFSTIPWQPMDPDNKLGLYVDPSSLMPVSRAAMRQMAMPLRQAGALDVQSFLEFLEVPNADSIAEKINRELQLAAIAKARKR